MTERGSTSDHTWRKRIAAFFPITTWLPTYSREWFRFDLLAGITLAAFSIPELIAYAELAGLPPEYGLYAGILAPIIYIFFGTIRQLSIGPSSSEAILLASVLGIIVVGDPGRYAALAALTAIMVGVMAIIARIFRLGFIVNLISATVLKGFLIGTGLVIIVGQLPKIFGIEGIQGSFFERLFYFLAHLSDTQLLTLAIGVGGIIFLIVAERRFPRLPNTLIVVILSIILVSVLNLAERGVQVVGQIPQGLPELGFPEFQAGDPFVLFPLAFALFILAYVETMSIGRSLSKEQHYPVNANQELLALGSTSIAAGMSQGFPIAGSFSRTEVNVKNHAVTPFAGGIAAVVIALVALWFTGLFANLPESIIGVIIVMAVFHLVDIAGLRRIASISRSETIIATATLFGVLVFGILLGVFIGVILSLLEMLFRVTYPHTAILGRIGDTNRFGDISRHPENRLTPGVFIFRVDAPLIFANSETVKQRILKNVEKDPGISLVILDMEASPIVDITAADMLGELNEELGSRSIALRLAEATGQVRDIIRAAGYEDSMGRIGQDTKISTVIAEWESEKRGPDT
jgi:high affinity sulfate transporter 1